MGGTECWRGTPPAGNDNDRDRARLGNDMGDNGADGAVVSVVRRPNEGGRQPLRRPLLEAPREEESDGTRRARESPLGRRRARERRRTLQWCVKVERTESWSLLRRGGDLAMVTALVGGEGSLLAVTMVLRVKCAWTRLRIK